MPAYITPGETWAANDLVTSARLTNHVAGLTILPRFITDQAAATTAVIANDYLMFWDAAANAFRKIKLADFFKTQLVDQAATVGSLRTLGTGANQAAPGASSASTTGINTFTGNNVFTADNTFYPGRTNISHLGGNYSNTPANIVKNANLGTTGTAVLGASSSHLCGRITLTPGGTGILLGIQASITFFGLSYYAGVPPHIMLIPYDGNAIAAQNSTKALMVANPTALGFDLNVAAALVSGTVYNWHYLSFAAE